MSARYRMAGWVIVAALLAACGGRDAPEPGAVAELAEEQVVAPTKDENAKEAIRDRAGEPSDSDGVRDEGEADEVLPQPNQPAEAEAPESAPPASVTFPIEVEPQSSGTVPEVALHLATAEGSGPLFEPQYAPPRAGVPGVSAFMRFAWSADGDTIAAIDDRGLWLVELDGDARQVVKGHVFDVAWGARTDLLAVRTAERTLVIDVAGGTMQEVWQAPAEPLGWSPDGRWLALAVPGEPLVLWHESMLTTLARGMSGMWLTDGRLIYRLGIFDPATGKTQPWDGLPCCSSVRFSADGTYAVRTRAPGVDLLDGESRDVLATFDGWTLPLGAADSIPVTTDGRVLLQRVEGDPCSDEGQTSTLAVGNPDGSVVPIAEQPFILMASWSPGGDSVAFVGFYSNLRVVDASGEAEPVAWVEGPVELFRWSPDGQSIAYWPALFGRSLCA